MEVWLPLIATALASIGASSGFWAWMMKRGDTREATTKLLLGLAHEKIIDNGMTYIRRGYVTKDEYDDFFKYLVKPYSEFGGNGLADKIVSEVNRLPIHSKKVITTGSLEIVKPSESGE